MGIAPEQVTVFSALSPIFCDEIRESMMEKGFRNIVMFDELEWYYSQTQNKKGLV